MAELIDQPKRHWALVVFGILSIMVGFVVTTRPAAGVLAFAILAGACFVVDGIFQFVDWVRNRGRMQSPAFELIMAIVSVILGALIIMNPLMGVDVLAVVISAGFIVAGAVEIASAFNARSFGAPNWGWVFFSGIIEILCGIVIFVNPAALALLIGCALVVRGCMFIGFGLQKY